jgi:hypothetical protein
MARLKSNAHVVRDVMSLQEFLTMHEIWYRLSEQTRKAWKNDPHSVSRILSDMTRKGHHVERGEQRHCTYSGLLSKTWRLKDRSQETKPFGRTKFYL